MTPSHLAERPAAAPAGGAALHMAEFRDIAAIMQQEACISLPETKVTLVHSRLSRRLREHRLASFADYVALVRRDDRERAVMVEALTTNHTHFFRESHHFDHLQEHVLPELKARAAQGQPVRLWSAGCSSGEEVYTLAMTLAGTEPNGADWLRHGNVKLLATDINSLVVGQVKRGAYPAQVANRVPEPYRSLWFAGDEDEMTIVPALRSLVTANVLNLFGPWPMTHRYDVIFCRNVMIYFDEEAKAALEERLVDQLAPGGYLYIGHSERLIGPAAARMQPVAQTAYQKVAA